MTSSSYISLINNTALLLVMGALYGSLSSSEKLRGKLVCGIALGLIGLGVMLNPWELGPGMFFDTRSIVLSVSGLFFGIIPTFIAMSITGLYRVYEGGAGALTGVCWIVGSGLFGIAWGKLRKTPAYKLSGWEFYFFGVVVQSSMLTLVQTMPAHLVAPILKQITLPTMLIFPIGSFLLAKLLANQETQIQNKLALDKSERQYRELVQDSQAIILRLDQQENCTFINDYAQAFFGFQRDEILGKRLSETIYSQAEAIDQESSDNENECVCLDGRQVQVLWKHAPVLDDSGRSIGTQSIGHDVTEQRQAEELLRAKEKQFHNLIEVSPVPLAIQEGTDKVVYVNRKFVEDFGYTLADIPRLDNWWVLAYPDEEYREKVRGNWTAAIIELSHGGREFEPQETRVTCKDGTIRDIVFMVSFIGGQNVVVFNDMSRAREIDRMKSEFIATAAHELNTPLASIAGFTEILLSEATFSPEEQNEYLSIVYEKTQVLERLIEDLLHIGRVESGRGIHLEREPSVIRQVIASSVTSYEKEFPKRQIDLDWSESCDQTVFVDPGKIGQVMDNLLSNAVKYSTETGAICVSAEAADQEIRITVQDQGIGMTSEQVNRIFERFYRADLSNTAVAGLGLGMAIVKNIIEAHDGLIWVESALGQGTSVIFTLPLPK